MNRASAAAEAALVVPAVFFFAALFLRNFLPADDPANGPQQVVLWYAARPWTLWILLVGLPLAALTLGGFALLGSWREDAALRQDAERVVAALRTHLAFAVTGIATASAGLTLLLVALHMAAG